MITREMYYRMRYLRGEEGLNSAQIAMTLDISESTVSRWLKKDEFEERRGRDVPRKLDKFRGRITELLNAFPYTPTQVFQRIKEDGYDGSYSTVKRYVTKVRPPVRKSYFKLHFSPGGAAQVDFGCCGKIPCENTERRLSVFVMVLCHSRYLFAEFIPCERQEHFLTCHCGAFHRFGGVPARIIVDNCKCAVSQNRRYEKPVYNPLYLDFASRCGFRPDACNPGNPHEKGIVENSVKYIKNNFMPGRRFGSLAEANTSLRFWLDNTANIRVHKATGSTPVELLEEERAALGPLPAVEPDCAIIKHCRADKRCRVWFDSNSYSVPSRCALTAVTVKAGPDEVLIYLNGKSVARHCRSYGRKLDIVDPDHQQELRAVRKKVNEQNLARDFLNIGPDAVKFLEELRHRELNAKEHMRRIVTLVEIYGRDPVSEAIRDMIYFKVFKAEYIEHRLMRAAAGNMRAGGKLHVPKAGDLLHIKLEKPNLGIYECKQEDECDE